MINETQARLRAIWRQVVDMPIGFEGWNEGLVAQLAVLPVEHRAALDILVRSNVLSSAITDRVQMALVESLAHIERSRALCYIMMPPIAAPRQDLLERAKALIEVEGTLDAATVALVRAALERDLAFLEANLAQKTPSDSASTAVRSAVQFLTELLLETPDRGYPQ